MLANVRIVLVNTSHPGNIGAAARAMKTMGLSHLYLVAPHHFPHAKADEMASGALDILEKAIVVNDLLTAIADCHIVVGTSARDRTVSLPLLTPRQLSEKVRSNSETEKMAIVFGCERAGLTNEELHFCHYQLQIPSNPEYSSLNVAAAVQIVAYELRVCSLDKTYQSSNHIEYATIEEVQGFYGHLEKVLRDIHFFNPKASKQLMRRLYRLFNRAQLETIEVNILRGILTAVEKKK